MQPDPSLNNHDLPVTPKVNYSGEVNIPVDKLNGWERLPVNTGPLLGSFLSTSCLHMDSISHGLNISVNSFFDERM